MAEQALKMLNNSNLFKNFLNDSIYGISNLLLL